jgi:serine/threonine protein kinase, bacterial
MTSQLLNDRYQIIRTLGSGGFGDTFLAEDTHMPSRRLCVVKRLRPVQANPQVNQLVQDRFQREAAILESLGSGHSQIPKLYAYFYSPADQQFYLVQEWVDGETLSSMIRQQGRLNEVEVRQILISLLPVFDYVHSQGIIHRDVKPDNIIVRRSPMVQAKLSTPDNTIQNQQPVLIDFGAVRETMAAGAKAPSRSTSIVIGTPGYMPSEQSVGRPVFSSDLYSLGMTAIYLLTGKRPQDFENNPHTSELIWQTDAPATSPELVDILNKSIAFNLRDRYQTAGEFLAVLQGMTQSAATQILATPTMSATEVVALSTPNQIPKPSAAIPKNLLPIGGIVAATAFSALLATMLLRPPESKVAVVTTTSASPSSSATPAISPTSDLEPVKITPSSAVQTPMPSVPIASRTSEAIATPSNNSTNQKSNIKSSCNYYAGEAVTGQAVSLDLCSITTNNSDQVGFVYYLGDRRMGSAANCSNGTWTTFSDQQVHRPLSPATQNMLNNVCSRQKSDNLKSNVSNSPVVKAISAATCKITDPTGTPLNIRERPNSEIIGTINNGRNISILKYAVDKNGKPWANIRDESGQTGWVIREFVSCY